MFNKRYGRYIQAFLLVLPMTGLVTAINTYVARGFEAVFTLGTAERWVISFTIAFPAVLFMAPLSVKLTERLVKSD